MWVVGEIVEGEGRHSLDISWHFGQGMQMGAENVLRMKAGSIGLAMLPAEGHVWEREVRKDVWSPVYGQKAPMTVLNFGLVSEAPVEFATLLVILEQAIARPGKFWQVKGEAQESPVQAYRYESNGSKTWFFFGESENPWRAGGVSSDAKFVCWRQSEDTGLSLLFCNGTHASVESGLKLRFRRSVAWAEVTLAGGERTMFSSDLAAADEDA